MNSPYRHSAAKSLALCAVMILATAGTAAGEVQGRCIQDDRVARGDSPFNGNFCTANDLTFVLIGLGIQEDGCLNSLDNSNILNLRAIVENTGASTRYDAGLWISIQADQTRCTISGGICATDADCSGGQDICASTARWGACAREIFREPAFVEDTDSCDPSSGGLDLACGDQGPYINDDGDGCGDVRKFGTNGPPDCGQTVDFRIDPTNAACGTTDTNQDQSVFDFEQPITFPCVDRDQDGFMEIPTCTSWGQNASDISCPSKTCSTAGTQCVEDADCPVSETCDAPACSICEGDGNVCSSDADCTAGQECTGTCTVTGAFCSDTVTCPIGQTCMTRTCQGSGDSCAVAADCPTGQLCNASSDPICRTQLAIPGTSAKCACEDGLNSNVPVAELGLTCTCDTPTVVQPGFPVTCELTYNNTQPVNCTPDPSIPERFQCGSNGYIRFDLDDGIDGAGSGTFSGICSGETGFCSLDRSISCSIDTDCGAFGPCEVPDCNVDGDCPGAETCSQTPTAGEVTGTASQYLWTPDPFDAGDTLGVIGTGDTESMRFIYTVSSSAPEGAITVTATSLWTNRTCSGSGEVCEATSQCPGGETCDLDFTAGVTQPLTTTCGITASATYVTVSSFKAIRDGGSVAVEWETSSEVGTLGFHVFRGDQATNSWVRLNETLLPAAQHVPGGTYRLEDPMANPNQELVYKLVEVDDRGGRRTHGPFRVRVETPAGRERSIGADRAFEVKAHAARPRKTEPARHRRAQFGGDRLGRRAERIKIEVTDSGIYRVEASQIAVALGTSVAWASGLIGTGNFSLTHRDETVFWHPSADGRAVIFYGEAIDSIYTRENVYWLAPGRGDQMAVDTARPARLIRDRLQSFAEKLPFEEDLLVRPTFGTDPEADYWFWQVIISGNPNWDRATVDLEVPGVAAGSDDAALTVRLFGFSADLTEPSYHALIRLNGREIGTVLGGASGWHEETIFFDQSWLAEGSNTVEVEGLEGSFFVDSFELEYQRRYEAVGGSLLLRGDGHDVVRVSGFSSRNIAVYDLADPRAPRRLQGVLVRWAADGSFHASFRPSDPETPYFVVEAAASRAPSSLQGIRPSGLRSDRNSADYLVITSPELLEAAHKLAEYRSGRGLDVVVVEVDEIMNEFNGGISSPEAIRSFLSHAYHNWRRAPRMAVLAGKGSYDYRNLLGQGGNFVPPIMVATTQGLVAADNLYGDVVGHDGIPEIAIGRLPVLTSEELETIVDKMVRYENSGLAAWTREVLMLADNPDKAGDFPTDSDALSVLIPQRFGLEKIYLSQPFTVEQARAQIIDSINLGTVLVSYVGHGGFDRLASEGILRSSDVDALVNNERLPVVAALTCNIGLFAFPGFTSLGEELLIHDAGGAAAVWAPTALSINSQAIRLGERVLESLLGHKQLPLGRALALALESYVRDGGLREVALSYSLLGDPALEWKGPRPTVRR